ncbi:MAG TPA: hypothetical protein VN723_02835 [Rhizomicrobium sp.]|nr:hypothetical protein [Rhizomicrobium sp.]
MKNTRLFALAAILSMSAALPALAALDTDTVYVSPDRYTSVSWSDFDGPVARLNLISDRTLDCDRITVHYRDGTAQDVFSGTLYSNERQSIAVPDGERGVSDVRLACRADGDFGARLSLHADVMPPPRHTYYTVPRRDPDALTATALQPIAEPDFGHWANHSIMVSGSGERQLNAVALQPVGADAQCRRLTTTFDDGSSSVSDVNGGAPLREGEIYSVRVDGQDRGLSGIGLTCQARNNDSVTIKVFGVG